MLAGLRWSLRICFPWPEPTVEPISVPTCAHTRIDHSLHSQYLFILPACAVLALTTSAGVVASSGRVPDDETPQGVFEKRPLPQLTDWDPRPDV